MKGESVKRAARRPRPAGVDVDPEAVRRARSEAGLTLAEVARGHVTRAAIHLIEAGKARPSMATLQLIAERTGKPISYFVAEPPLKRPSESAAHPVRRQSRRSEWPEVTRLEALALTGDPALGEAATRLTAAATDPHVRAHAYYYLGVAQVDSRQPLKAVDSFRTGRRLFNQLGDDWMVVECTDAEAGALYRLERPEALTVAEEALARCRGLKPVPTVTEVRILGHIGAIHTSMEQWNEAIRWYEEALQRAEPFRDLVRLARMFQDLSLAYQGIGALSKADDYAHKALGLYRMQQNREALAYMQNNLALVEIERDRLAAAEQHLHAALSDFESLGLERRKSNVLLTLSDLERRRDNLDLAETYARDALRLAEANEEHLTAAKAHQALGELAATRHDVQETDRRFSAAIALLTRVLTEPEVSERLVACHQRYSRILEERGDRDAAYKQLKLAMAIVRPPVPTEPARRDASGEEAS